MRQEKLTTKFQEALADAQSLALANDHAYIEPAHLLVAMIKQEDGPKALLQRAGVNLSGLLAGAEAAVKRRKRSAQARRPVCCQRAVLAGAERLQGHAG